MDTPSPLDPAPEAADGLTQAELAGAPSWLIATARLVRPLCVGALMAIPTVGAASIGLVAMVSRSTAMAMADASISFLSRLPDGVLVLIGSLATGYGLAKSVERLRGNS